MDFDELKDKAADLVDEHGDKIRSGIDKAADVADDKTGRKHSDKIDSIADQAKSVVDKLAGTDDQSS